MKLIVELNVFKWEAKNNHHYKAYLTNSKAKDTGGWYDQGEPMYRNEDGTLQNDYQKEVGWIDEVESRIRATVEDYFSALGGDSNKSESNTSSSE